MSVPLVLLAARATGSFAVAGAAAAVQAAGVALSAPVRGRVVDRLGAARVVAPLAIVQAAALVGLALIGHHGGSAWAIILLAGVVGAFAPPLPATMRLEWQRLLGYGDPRLEKAYAFESIAQVSLFVVGPALAGLGVATVGPGGTLAIAAGLALAGGLGFALLAKSAGSPRGHDRRALDLIRNGGIRSLVLITLLADASLGIVDVAVIAFAKKHGSPAAGGPLLAIFAAGSVLAGVAYGARSWRTAATSRLAALTAVASAAYLTLAFADSLLALGCLLAVAGAPFTAQWATTSVVLDRVAPASAAAEAYNWLSSANSAGVSIGSLAAGAVIQVAGTEAAFAAAAASVAAASAVAAVRRRALGDRPCVPRHLSG